MTDHRWVAIRVDCSEAMGSGHLMRCLTLADALTQRGRNVVFFADRMLVALADRVEQQGHHLVYLDKPIVQQQPGSYTHSVWLGGSQEDDADSMVIALAQVRDQRGVEPELLIVDHYALGAPWESRFEPHIPVLALDDLNDRPHLARFVLDQTLGKSPLSYDPWVTEDTTVLAGIDYAILRSEFVERRTASLARRTPDHPVRKVLVTLGGVDRENVTERVLEALSCVNHRFTAIVVAGVANPHYRTLQQKAAQQWPWARVLDQTTDMADLMTQADFCVGAAGSSSWERCALGLPTVNVVLAQNQRVIAQNLDTAGAAANFGELGPDRIEELSRTLQGWFIADEERYRMAVKAADLCDGRGVERVLQKVGLNENQSHRTV